MSDGVIIVKTPKRTSGGGGQRKYGRNTKKCAKYSLEGRREKNKSRKKVKQNKRMAKLELLRKKREQKVA